MGEGCQALLAPLLAAVGDGLDSSSILPNSAFKVDPPALIMRPGINFENGRRYIVAMRNLRDADGALIEAPRASATPASPAMTCTWPGTSPSPAPATSTAAY